MSKCHIVGNHMSRLNYHVCPALVFLKLFLELIFLVFRPFDQVDVPSLKIEKYYLETNEMILMNFKRQAG